MRQWWLSFSLTLGLLVCGYGDGVAAPTWQYVAEGVGAMVQYDYAAARGHALQGAFREALEQAVLDMVEPQALVRNLQHPPPALSAPLRIAVDIPGPAPKGLSGRD